MLSFLGELQLIAWPWLVVESKIALLFVYPFGIFSQSSMYIRLIIRNVFRVRPNSLSLAAGSSRAVDGVPFRGAHRLALTIYRSLLFDPPDFPRLSFLLFDTSCRLAAVADYRPGDRA